jgi:glutamine synthetase
MIYTLLRTGLEGPLPDPADAEGKRARTRFLPDNIYDAIRLFKTSRFAADILGENSHGKFAELKQASADRCPKELGTLVKRGEVMFHHEVTNQLLWNSF